MKFNILKYCIFCSLLMLSTTSCSDFLDNDPENQITMDEVFQHQKTTEEYLANVYSYMRPQNAWSNEAPWTAISDELDVTYPDYNVSLINLGSLTPDKGWFDTWAHYYKGIRAASYFINRVDENKEMPTNLVQQYKSEARYLRAWYYFCLVRQYGPIVILPENLISPDASVSEMTLPRNTIKESFTYISKELDQIIALNKLPEIKPLSTSDYGRITIATCKALNSRVLLYAASDFYNKDANNSELYRSFKNEDGTELFDYTNSDKATRWQKAADAAKEVINMSFSLYKFSVGGVINPYLSYQNLFIEDWNSEVIFAKASGGFWEMDYACSPRFVNGWSGWAPTQKIVDMYYTKNGLPIDQDPSYSELGVTTTAGDNGYTQKGTFKMYSNREPRFYMSICFNNSKWFSAYNTQTVQFYYGGNNGKTNTETRNYSQTGYLCRKFVNPSSNTGAGKTTEHAQIYFRLGEMYLNYVEALNEVNYSANLSEILIYLNQIRERAGIPIYGTGPNEVSIPTNQDKMREAIRRERQIELAFEEHRYFDCVRWGIATQEFNGSFQGMDINATTSDEFNKRVVFETRVYPERYCLWPIVLEELYKGKKLVQNPGWSGR